jgi:hypothetical protein
MFVRLSSCTFLGPSPKGPDKIELLIEFYLIYFNT